MCLFASLGTDMKIISDHMLSRAKVRPCLKKTFPDKVIKKNPHSIWGYYAVLVKLNIIPLTEEHLFLLAKDGALDHLFPHSGKDTTLDKALHRCAHLRQHAQCDMSGQQ